MKYFIYIQVLLLFTGCLYFNDRGVSAHLYDNCHSYYDENGNFIEKCDENLIDYDEAKESIIEIKEQVKVLNSNNDLEQKNSSEEIPQIVDDPCECKKEIVEPEKCPCR
jgi:hypothetical protein